MYLSGADSPTLREKMHEAGRTDIGLMCQPRSGVSRFITDYPAWAADNGCFTQGERFNMDRWLTWLASLTSYKATCLFAVVPDVVADAKATLARSLPIIPRVRELGFPVALAAQDGLERLQVPWDAFDVLFIGGTTKWKTSEHAARLVAEAKARGKGAHMGRVNGLPRMRAAQSFGCDSADGTNIAFAPRKNARRVMRWMTELERQPSLWQAEVQV